MYTYAYIRKLYGPGSKVPDVDRREETGDEEAYVEVVFDLSYDITNWLHCASHFFQVRFLRDERNIMWTASNCLDLRRFATTHVHEEDEFQDYIKEPL
jgi:hypothetical protein